MQKQELELAHRTQRGFTNTIRISWLASLAVLTRDPPWHARHGSRAHHSHLVSVCVLHPSSNASWYFSLSSKGHPYGVLQRDAVASRRTQAGTSHHAQSTHRMPSHQQRMFSRSAVKDPAPPVAGAFLPVGRFSTLSLVVSGHLHNPLHLTPTCQPACPMLRGALPGCEDSSLD